MVQCWEEGYGSMLGRLEEEIDGSMLGRRVWFDSGQKGTVQWWVEGLGSIVGRRVGCLGGA